MRSLIYRVMVLVNDYVRADIGADTVDADVALRRSRQWHARMITYNLHHTRLINVCIARLHGLVNVMKKTTLVGDEYDRSLRDLLIMLHPFCPHMTAELWQALCEKRPGVFVSDIIYTFSRSRHCVETSVQ